MAREPLHCEQCAVGDRAACSVLTTDERDELAKLGHRRFLKRGETLFAAGDENQLGATLTKGLLKVASFDENGTEHIVSLIHPAGFAGELFAAQAHHDIIALSDCELCVFPRPDYERALERFPGLARALLERSWHDLVQSRSLLAAVTGRSAMHRVARFLLEIGRATNDAQCHPAIEFDMVLTRGEIASLLGLTIETVSRQLTKLEREGVIRRKGARSILLLDAARLGTLAA